MASDRGQSNSMRVVSINLGPVINNSKYIHRSGFCLCKCYHAGSRLPQCFATTEIQIVKSLPTNQISQKQEKTSNRVLYYLQSTDHDWKHSRYGQSSICIMVPHKPSSIPQKQGITTKYHTKSRTQPESLYQSAPIPNLLSHTQRHRIRSYCYLLAHEWENRANLCQGLQIELN